MEEKIVRACRKSILVNYESEVDRLKFLEQESRPKFHLIGTLNNFNNSKVKLYLYRVAHSALRLVSIGALYLKINYIACVASVSVGSGAKKYRVKKEGAGGGGGEGLPHPLFLILALAPISRGQNTVPWSFFAPQPHGNACYAGYC